MHLLLQLVLLGALAVSQAKASTVTLTAAGECQSGLAHFGQIAAITRVSYPSLALGGSGLSFSAWEKIVLETVERLETQSKIPFKATLRETLRLAEAFGYRRQAEPTLPPETDIRIVLCTLRGAIGIQDILRARETYESGTASDLIHFGNAIRIQQQILSKIEDFDVPVGNFSDANPTFDPDELANRDFKSHLVTVLNEEGEVVISYRGLGMLSMIDTKGTVYKGTLFRVREAKRSAKLNTTNATNQIKSMMLRTLAEIPEATFEKVELIARDSIANRDYLAVHAVPVQGEADTFLLTSPTKSVYCGGTFHPFTVRLVAFD